MLVSYRPLASSAYQKSSQSSATAARPVPKQCYRAHLGRQTSHPSKMYVTAVQIAEFLIVVVILMSLPKLVTS